MSTDDRAVIGAPAAGTLVGGKYRVVGVVGSGGMGCLVKAEHLLLKKDVAIKFVLASRGESAQRRLLREGRAAQSLSSEHVVRVFDLGMHDESPYIVMELLQGTDLAERVSAVGPLPVEDAVDYLLESCVAVAEAHAVGIVHRDIKPANLFLARTATRDIVKVLDFGISKVPPPVGHDDPDKTAEDAVLGTPHYASPEQLRNPTQLDGRADIWSLGVTLFHLLSAEHPFPGATGREIIAATFGDPPRSLLDFRPDIPEGIWQAIEKTLAKRPEARTSDVAELVTDLLPFASKRGRRAAEQVLGMEKMPAAPTPAPPIAATVGSATTEESLSSTLPTSATGDAAPSEGHVPLEPRMRWPIVAGVALTLAAAVAMGWGLRTSPAPSSAAPTTATEPSPPEGEAPASTAPIAAIPGGETEASAPSATAEPSASASPAPAPAAVALRPAQPSSASSALAPPATPSAPAAAPIAVPPPAVPHDIDGVPIVD